MGDKLILRMKDGTMIRCTTRIPFSAAYEKVTVIDDNGEVHKIPLNQIKAIFFVKDFMGNPHYKAGKEFTEGSPKAGKTVTVEFEDGEIIKGKALNFNEDKNGFFLYPADPLDNNEKVFVIKSSTKNIIVENE